MALHQLGIETDMTSAMVAASPLGFHSLQEVAGKFHFQLRLPLSDKRRHGHVKKRFVPFVDFFGALRILRKIT